MDQGKYGEKNIFWRCPNCETYNTDSTCSVCGYKNQTDWTHSGWICCACGHQNSEDAKFCVECKTSREGKQLNKHANPKKRNSWIVAALVAIALTVVVMAVLHPKRDIDSTVTPAERVTISAKGEESNPETAYKVSGLRELHCENVAIDPFFWGQHEIKRSDISKIVFTREPGDVMNSWDLSEKQDGSILAYVNDGTLYITSQTIIKLKPDSHAMFFGFSTVREIDFGSMVDTSDVTSMVCMFQDCSSLTELDLSGWETSQVMDMKHMFNCCKNLTKLDISNWDTSNVTNMQSMFIWCTSLKELDVSNWNTSMVEDMEYMFSNCFSLKSLNVSNWDTTNVSNMRHMFYRCYGLTELDISKWNISGTDMTEIYE